MNIRKSEIYRYMGMRQGGAPVSPVIEKMTDEVLEKVLAKAEPIYTVREFSLSFPAPGVIQIGDDGEGIGAGMTVRSENLVTNLTGCTRILLFAATLGPGPDKLTRRYEVTNMAKALTAQACGAEVIEAFCDETQESLRQEYAEKGFSMKPRFSPGYGDFALAHQRDFFRLLEMEKKLGIRLSDQLLMIPSKSVTAVIGLLETPQNH